MIQIFTGSSIYHNRLFKISWLIVAGILLFPAIQGAEWEKSPMRANGTVPVWIIAGPLSNGNADT
jgi:hypothetical protein